MHHEAFLKKHDKVALASHIVPYQLNASPEFSLIARVPIPDGLTKHQSRGAPVTADQALWRSCDPMSELLRIRHDCGKKYNSRGQPLAPRNQALKKDLVLQPTRLSNGTVIRWRDD